MLGGSVLWFRQGLRLHDNPALHAALESGETLFPIFIFGKETTGNGDVGFNRMRYLLEALEDLDQQFQIAGGRLLMIQGEPSDIIRRLWEEFGVRRLSFERECTAERMERDEGVRWLCRDTGIVCGELVSHTLWDPAGVVRANGGIPPLTYEMFLHTVSTMGPPPRPEPDVDLSRANFGTLPQCFYDEYTVYDKVPSPEQLGVFPDCDALHMVRWRGGETAALQLLQARLQVERDSFRRGSFLPSHASPDLLGPPVSLSPALRYGCLSVRRFYWALHDLFKEVHNGQLPPNNSITGQLIWREYFYTMSVNNPKYGEMVGNPICLDIPWREPDAGELQRWELGKTGFPFVDAAMRQLRSEGWLHHVTRNTVAAFLTRGTLWLSWEYGLRHFLKYLLDADWSVCAGNWMWVSSSAFEAMLDSSECACPVMLGQRLDPSGEYVRRYVPELAGMPVDYIYEPWRAPLEVQERAGCVIGRDYPSRMVDHQVAAQRNRRAIQDLKSKLVKAAPHCRPSSEQEIHQFMWLQDDLADDHHD